MSRILDESVLIFRDGLHAMEHAAIGVLPLFALCDRNDIGGLSTPLHPDTGRPQGVYSRWASGGSGDRLSTRVRDHRSAVDGYTGRRYLSVPAGRVVPAASTPLKCGNNNQPLDKAVATLLAKGIS